jgi:ATP-dependent protease Clp ATPase subunit
MTKKNRESTLEKLETKAKSEQEEMMNQLKKCTPEQLKAFGLNQEMIDQLLKKDVTTETEQADNKLHETSVETPLDSVTKSSLDNMFDIPDIKIPKMSTPINAQIINTL